MEELQSALQDWGLAVSNVPEKGRCLVTIKDLYPGEVIISQEPYICVPNNSATESRCDGCFASGNLKKCSACQVVWYCGSTCQKSEWKLHRLECDALSKLDKDRRKSVTPSIRLMVKLYLWRKLQSEKTISATATDNYNLVEELVAHMKDIDEEQLVLYAKMANLVNLILQWPDINIKEIAENFSKVMISYIETAGSTMTRQKSLKQQYFFTCTCPCCIKVQDDIRESAILEGYRCKYDRCNGFLLRDSDDKGFVCQQCGLLRSKEEVKKIAAEIRATSDKASKSLSSGNLQEAISMHKMIEKLQQKLFHPFSISLMQTRDKLLKMLMELKDWRDALSYCKLTIPVYQRVYPEFHPLLGLQYYTSGKLEWLLGKTEDAIKSLTKAVHILRITHGTNTLFVKELIMKLEEARAEASYKLSSKDDE
ncbi:histone-lysine N-methyltransferase ASHR1 isoform X7 [Hevea brasiliensis]|uniref:histone-lysine N-methyltransferase ASHR1 isoform X7 n=1 Tax=Hevea brasiliensis TaxID=3981 RepID=UPI0025E4CAEF|nr:histone-lysine N-methyltransferase ASHR1 isoform X7 [Hevea brasiliensis]